MPEVMFDTSVWVAIFEGSAVREQIAALPDDMDTLTSPVVLAELASLQSRGRLERTAAIEDVLAIARVEELTVDDSTMGGELHGRMRKAGNSKVSLADCLIYVTARRVGATLFTLDAGLAAEPGVDVLGAPKKRKKP